MKMTDEDVLRLADEAGAFVSVSDAVFALDAMNRFAQLCYQQGALDMRERCAKACEEYTLSPFWRASVRDLDLAAACRALET